MLSSEKEVIQPMDYGSIPRASHFCLSTAAAGEPKSWTTI
jgi:hypothetical protein